VKDPKDGATVVDCFAEFGIAAEPEIDFDLDNATPASGALRKRCQALRPDEVTGFGDAQLWSETTRLDLRVAEVPEPRPGDRIGIDGELFTIQGEPLRDTERLVWTIDLRPA
jgi:hypothetical protein